MSTCDNLVPLVLLTLAVVLEPGTVLCFICAETLESVISEHEVSPHVFASLSGVLALQCSHPGGGNGALLWRLFVLRPPHRGRLLLRHVPG